MEFDRDNRVLSLQELSDPEEGRAIVDDDIYVAWLRAGYGIVPGVEEVELVRAGLQHKGVSLHRTTQYHEDDDIECYDGVMGRYLVQFNGMPESDVKKLIDRATSGKIQHKPLGQGSFLRIDCRLAELMEQAEGQPWIDTDDIPEQVSVRFRREQNSLVIHVDVRG